jgi:hypothetical protein
MHYPEPVGGITMRFAGACTSCLNVTKWARREALERLRPRGCLRGIRSDEPVINFRLKSPSLRTSAFAGPMGQVCGLTV